MNFHFLNIDVIWYIDDVVNEINDFAHRFFLFFLLLQFFLVYKHLILSSNMFFDECVAYLIV